MKEVIIYTDGSCIGNPGPGGYAAILLKGEEKYKLSGGEKETTNNRMELLAVTKALAKIKERSAITIYSDSQYIINAINKKWLMSWKNNGWCRNGGELKNKDLWIELDELIKQHKCNFVWVKGHNGDKYNEICDKLAKSKAEEYAKMEIKKEVCKKEEIEETEQSEQLELNKAIANVAHYFQKYIQKSNLEKFGVKLPCAAHLYCEYCDYKDDVSPCVDAYMSMEKKGANLWS